MDLSASNFTNLERIDEDPNTLSTTTADSGSRLLVPAPGLGAPGSTTPAPNALPLKPSVSFDEHFLETERVLTPPSEKPAVVKMTMEPVFVYEGFNT